MSIFRTAPAIIFLAALTACAAGREKEQAGAVVGAGLGALAGSQIGDGKGQLAAIAVGTLLGAWAGSEVGRQLDERDRLLHHQTAQQAFEVNTSGAASTWTNPDTGHSGTVTPVKTYQTTAGQYCREYQQTITVGGQTEQAYGTACRQPDGSWQIANQ
jgi:surface antigen